MRILIGILLLGLITACSQNSSPPQTETPTGLIPDLNSHLDELFRHPTLKLNTYQTISINVTSVSYTDRKHPLQALLREQDFQLNDKQLASFKTQIIKGFSRGLDLTANDNNTDLIATINISHLYLNAPISHTIVKPDKFLVDESSRMQVEIEIIDKAKHLTVLKLKDRLTTGRQRTGTGNLSPMTSVSYWQDVFRAFRALGKAAK